MNNYAKWTIIVLAIIMAVFAAGCAKSKYSEGSDSIGTIYQTAEMKAADYDNAIEVRSIAFEDEAGYAQASPSKMHIPPKIETEGPYGAEESTEIKIIKNAHMSIEVNDYFLAAQKVEAYSKKYGGYVSSSDGSADKNNKHRGSITIRVPEIHFDATLAELTLLGKLTSKNLNGEDVTEQYVDLTARIENSKEHEKRLLKMYDNATDVYQMMSLEQQISSVRENIERMEGKLRYMDNKISLSTITVNLYEPTPVVKEWGIWKSMKQAFNHMLSTLRFLIELFGFLIPLAIVGLISWKVVRLIISKRNRDVRKK